MSVGRRRIVVGIAASFDAAWQKRSSGHRYDSLSCHAVLVGEHTRKPIALVVFSKKCSTCDRAGDGEDVPEHECPCNVDCSSKAMEPRAGLQLLINVWETMGAYVKTLLMDDDSSTEAKCKHRKSYAKADKGELPAHIPEPTFLADPNHRVKVIGKKVFALVQKPKAVSVCTKSDALRIKKNFAYFVRQYRTKPFEEFVQASNAVVEHHFNNHQHCGDWCPAKKKIANNETPAPAHRDKSEDGPAGKVLYNQIKDAIGPYLTRDSLKQLHHTMDSQVNESLNRVISKYAPKDRTYCMTMALQSRVHLAIGVYLWGWEKYYSELFKKLRMEMTGNTLHFLQRKDRINKRTYDYYRKTAVKRRRANVLNEKIKRLVEEERRAKMRGEVYASGSRLDSTETTPATRKRKGRAKKDDAKVSPKECARCFRWNHQRASSKKCPCNKDYDKDDGDDTYSSWVREKMDTKELTREKVGSVRWAELLMSANQCEQANEVIAEAMR
jgi:hypothetical protein